MVQQKQLVLTDLEQQILIAIRNASEASVKEVHTQFKHRDFLNVMRDIHSLHRKGYVSQRHIRFEARYRIKPSMVAALQKLSYIP